VYALLEVKKLDLPDNLWPSMPTADYLPIQRLHHFTLGPILENKGTIKGTYSVLRNIFGGNNGEGGFQEGQLGYKNGLFTDELVLINSD